MKCHGALSNLPPQLTRCDTVCHSAECRSAECHNAPSNNLKNSKKINF